MLCNGLRRAAVAELIINASDYRPLYAIDDNGQQQQAPTFDLFVVRTEEGTEWATELTITAMARSLDLAIQVVSSGVSNGQPTATLVTYVAGVNHPDKIITVAYNSAEGHYLAMPLKSGLPPIQD